MRNKLRNRNHRKFDAITTLNWNFKFLDFNICEIRSMLYQHYKLLANAVSSSGDFYNDFCLLKVASFYNYKINICVVKFRIVFYSGVKGNGGKACVYFNFQRGSLFSSSWSLILSKNFLNFFIHMCDPICLFYFEFRLAVSCQVKILRSSFKLIF